MLIDLLHSLTALFALLPAALLVFRPEARRDAAFWGAVGLALVGASAMGLVFLGGHWMTGLAPALWVSIAATLLIFSLCAATIAQTWRLLSLLAPYLLAMGLGATIWQHTVGGPLPAAHLGGWVSLHILFGVATYALLTLAAVAGLAAFLQERALKRKAPNRLTRHLPSVADAEQLSTRLLVLAEVVLGLGVVSGSAVNWLEKGTILTFDHKSLLSLLVFIVIGVLLFAKRAYGIRGRMAARFILLAWLLLTLAYPGVKFVTEVLIG